MKKGPFLRRAPGRLSCIHNPGFMPSMRPT
ncbi:hypothetical protein MAC3UK_0040 [Bdellovibrio phage MAC3UK]|nr:hypothetical protein MAC3UK_0040 [Bdellovibrio phage MAC3UK]